MLHLLWITEQGEACTVAPQPKKKGRKTQTPLPITVYIGLIALVIGVSAWMFTNRASRNLIHNIVLHDQGMNINLDSQNAVTPINVSVPAHVSTTGKQGTPTSTLGTPIITGTRIPLPIATTTQGTGTSRGVSPLLFGTNMGLFDSSDQVLTSASTRTLLQQMHTTIIRMPLRSSLSEATEVQAAQVIKSLGAIPLVVLNGALVSDPLTSDKIIINDMNRVFGKSIVYYEYGNEEDLNGIPVSQYIASWNSVVPQLKQLALNGHFIGPVNYQYDANYLMSFLQNANPRPNEISWHEYTCDDSWAKDVCISHIANWSNHIQNARTVMMTAINTTLPIMITEWNYAPNASLNDGKNNDNTFMSTWTSQALQTLAANAIFASMQYSCTNTAIPMIDSSGAPTVQGQTFKQMYQSIIG